MSERYTQVDDGLWRGPRPLPSDYEWINANVDVVIVLDGDDEYQVEDRALSPRVLVVSYPISDWQIYNPFRGVQQAYMDAIVAAMWSPGRVLVHCLHGQDRTGLAVAMYRVRHCPGWTKDRAMAEALAFGYRKWINFGLNRTWEAFNG